MSAAAGGAGDAVFSMAVKLLYLATRLCLPPLILAHISLADYGMWSACFIVLGYVGMADLGFSTIYVRSAARLHAGADTAGIGALLSTGIAAMCVLALATGCAVWLLLPFLLEALHVAPPERARASTLILGALLVFLIDLCLNAFAYVLQGIGRFRAEQRAWMAGFLLEMVTIAALLAAGLGVFALLLAFALRYAVSIATNIGQLYRALPGLRIGRHHFRASLLPHFFGFGLRVQASSFVAMALHSIDRLLAGMLLGPQALALFDLGAKLPVAAASVPAAITQLTLPAAARLQQRSEVAALYLRNTRAVALVAAWPMAFLAWMAAPLALAWLGPRADAALIARIMACAALAAWLHISTGPASAVCRAAGGVANEFVYHGLRIGAIVLALAGIALFGRLDAAAMAPALCAAGSGAAVLYLLHSQRALGVGAGPLVSRVLAPAAMSWLSGAVLHAAWQQLGAAQHAHGRWDTLQALAVCAAAHAALTLLLSWPWLDADERAWMRRRGRAAGIRVRAWGRP